MRRGGHSFGHGKCSGSGPRIRRDLTHTVFHTDKGSVLSRFSVGGVDQLA